MIHAGAGNDLVFGDHGRIAGDIDANQLPLSTLVKPFSFTAIDTQTSHDGGDDLIYGEADNDILLGQQGDDTIYAGSEDDDLIGGHNVAGGHDIVYGGLGDDWIHAGAGDDALSGAEALADFYNDSTSQADVPPIAYDSVTRKLEFYDADNPRLKIDGFLLNFEAADTSGTKIEDGKDRLFGDLGNDWIVGGTGSDRLFGGLGDDVTLTANSTREFGSSLSG